jgi:hypothetical protein
MRRMILAAATAAALLLAITAGLARADPASRHTISFSGQEVFPAGTLCDFNYEFDITVNGMFTSAPNGYFTVQFTEYITHTNLDTGYSLSEVDQVNSTNHLGDTFTSAGIFTHLRDANGHTVLVLAGEAVFDNATGQVISFTPNSGFDQTFAQIICPALGGSPA